jgi:propane monooxygenase small subunit
VSTPPGKTVSDDGGRARLDDSMRAFEYFTPARRRASLYEDVTIDTQPSVHRHMDRGWPVSFEDGRGTWSDDSTAIRSQDWFAFRDPGQEWERSFYQAGAGYERQIENAVRSANADRLFDDFSPEWAVFLRSNLQVPAYVEHGLWLATATIARDCLSDSITHCVVLQSAIKQRLAQSIVLYALDLEPYLGDLPIAAAKERFLTHAAWQPARRLLEELRTIDDWMELLVAANVCFEPVVGVLIRRELGIRAATANGDSVTPVIARAGQLEWAWVAGWTAELMRFVIADTQHGAANRGCIERWTARWMPEAHAAAEAIGGIVEELPIGIPFSSALERIRRDTGRWLGDMGLGGMAELGR